MPAPNAEGLDKLLQRNESMGEDAAESSFARVASFCRSRSSTIARRSHPRAHRQGMIRIPGGTFDFQVTGSRSKAQLERRGRAVSMGRFAAPLSPAPDDDEAVLHRPLSGDERRVQEVHRRAHYHPKDDHNFLRDWNNGTSSDRLGEQASDLGIARRCARLCGVGRQAPAARMGMAVRGAGHGRPAVSVGQRLETMRRSRRPTRAAI